MPCGILMLVFHFLGIYLSIIGIMEMYFYVSHWIHILVDSPFLWKFIERRLLKIFSIPLISYFVVKFIYTLEFICDLSN